jgi:hypothetical protein
MVVDGDGDPVLGAELDDLGDVGLERRVAAGVLDDLRAVQPCRASVRRGVDAQHDRSPAQRSGTRTDVWYHTSPT